MLIDPRVRKKTAAAYKPLTLDQCKAHLRITYTDANQDAMITGYLAAAVDELEQLLQRTLVETTWVATFPTFPGSCMDLTGLPARLMVPYNVTRSGREALKLRMAPILSVTSVKYLDSTGVQQTLATSDYQVDAVSEPGMIFPAAAKAWPATQAGAVNAVEVEYKAGYLAQPADEAAAAAAVPPALIAWLLIRVGTLWANRDQVTTGAQPGEISTLRALMDPYRILEA